MQQHENALDLAESTLHALPTRLAHCYGVAARMSALVGDHLDIGMLDNAWRIGLLHDVGYGVPQTGHHAIDGALHLRETALSHLAPHIAWHGTAEQEAHYRSLDIEDATGLARPSGALLDLLWVADFTTSPTGETIAPYARLDDIRARYPHDSAVVRALDDTQETFEQLLDTYHIPRRDPPPSVDASLSRRSA